MKKQAKVILFSGPPDCGKSSFVNLLFEVNDHSRHFPTKSVLHPIVMVLFDIPSKRYWELYHDKDLKNAKVHWFHWDGEDHSLREAMIFVSEKLLKPNLGNDFLVKKRNNDFLAPCVEQCIDFDLLLEDSVMEDEMPSIVKDFGAENVLLFQIHREGYTFERLNDSRSYVDGTPYGVETVIVDNKEGKFDEVYDFIEGKVKTFLNRP